MNSSTLGGQENCPVQIYDNFVDGSISVAKRVAEIIKSKEKVVLGLCSGSSPSDIYTELLRLHRDEELSFKNVTIFILDEFYPIAQSAIQSKYAEISEKLLNHIDIEEKNIYSLNGSTKDPTIECKEYELSIKKAGGMDFLIVGVGATGHIGANEPGTHFSSRTRRVPLDSVTRIDAASHFKGEQFVPSSALTMGLGTIMEAKEVVLLAFGEGKSTLVREIAEGEVTPSLPATVLQNHPNMIFVVDKDSASKLTRIRSPWVKEVCDWSDDEFVKKAVIWLARHTKKSILKLTNRDYMDNGMADLLNIYDSAYSINIKLFNTIQSTITGWPGGKPNVSDEGRPERAEPALKRVVVFSPHPDDDVISMGGTLQRLVDHGHEVHVAYQTNGNVAVADDKVQDIVDLLRSLNDDNKIPLSVDRDRLKEIEESLNLKDPLAADINEVQFLKGLIRKVETISACRFVGIPIERNHHLDLPFYHTGEVRKKPLSQDDINIVIDFLQKVKPHQIFAAGDLSDPHGTHRVCLNAIFEAFKQLRGEPWLKNCRVWLYRGAWAEWPIAEADMAVPISPEELMKKRISIFRHGSQKDGIVFPGSDSREFWQRAEARNRGTAEKYNELGFAEYEAIELFVRYHDF
jgi:glucosamine-6-phosphate deaminase